ncbi:sulfotransferase family 2 domain-containing protein [Luteolibacter ambystomatis]|uniref:Sulfotransferase family 2 domain-containing protein n=1 Tax=Luteolibacter ambystomatis TaxID=2824561 RepID=A0A975J0S2_9BACT|nr:sulfotransferase family 2 domain-containing protein [Luteolibacter ambystomatis]QUE51915.1 sulfotransferase family 2 domain-containing protein [Luteolibacter ambystomatis]
MLADCPKPWLFIHIPKTAGTSIERALSPMATGVQNPKDFTQEQLDTFGLPGGLRKAPPGQRPDVLSQVIQHESIRFFERRGQVDGRYIFTVVRNPHDRALSELFYLLRTSAEARAFFTGPSWADDLKRLADFNGYISHDLGASQADWLTDSTGKIRCDRVLRFESLQDDWQHLCADLGITAQLPHIHNSKRSYNWSDYYDDEAFELIGRKYARDFEAFGYSMERPAPEAADKPVAGPLALSSIPGFANHRRLELPDGVLNAIEADGIWENFEPAEAMQVATECYRVIRPGGTLKVLTHDLGAASQLLEMQSEDAERYVVDYMDKHLPVANGSTGAPVYAPAFVLNHWMHKHAFVYDEGMLVETLAEAAFSRFDREDAGFARLAVTARK